MFCNAVSLPSKLAVQNFLYLSQDEWRDEKNSTTEVDQVQY